MRRWERTPGRGNKRWAGSPWGVLPVCGKARRPVGRTVGWGEASWRLCVVFWCDRKCWRVEHRDVRVCLVP